MTGHFNLAAAVQLGKQTNNLTYPHLSLKLNGFISKSPPTKAIVLCEQEPTASGTYIAFISVCSSSV